MLFDEKIQNLIESLSPCQFVVVTGHEEPSLFPQISQDLIIHANQVLHVDIKILADLSEYIRWDHALRYRKTSITYLAFSRSQKVDYTFPFMTDMGFASFHRHKDLFVVFVPYPPWLRSRSYQTWTNMPLLMPSNFMLILHRENMLASLPMFMAMNYEFGISVVLIGGGPTGIEVFGPNFENILGQFRKLRKNFHANYVELCSKNLPPKKRFPPDEIWNLRTILQGNFPVVQIAPYLHIGEAFNITLVASFCLVTGGDTSRRSALHSSIGNVVPERIKYFHVYSSPFQGIRSFKLLYKSKVDDEIPAKLRSALAPLTPLGWLLLVALTAALAIVVACIERRNYGTILCTS